MLIEQIIEVKLRGPGSPGRTCTSITGQLHERKFFEWIIIYCYNIAEGMFLTSPIWTKSLQLKFYTIMQDFKRVLKFNCKFKED